jgi:hypothetical protein
MESFLFFGEFGYLQQTILAYTQRFVKRYPEKKGTITLLTFAGNDFSFESLFPGYFKFALLPLQNERAGFNSPYELAFSSIPHISLMFDEPLPKWLGELPYTGDMRPYYIDAPIPCPSYPELDALITNYTKIVVCFFRNRNHEQHRNFDITHESLKNEIETHATNMETLVCIYAGSDECAIPSYINLDNRNIYCIKTLEESAYWFHRCDISYMNDSGLCDFAKNCKNKKMVIVPGTNNVLFNASIYYNPFQTEIEVLGEYTLQV